MKPAITPREKRMLLMIMGILRESPSVLAIKKQEIMDRFRAKCPNEAPMTVKEAGETLVRAYRLGFIDVDTGEQN